MQDPNNISTPGDHEPSSGRRIGYIPRLIGGLALVAGVGFAGVQVSHNAAPIPAPYELNVEGEIDMGAVYDGVKSSITATSTELDRAGVKVFKLAEFIPTPGIATVGQAELVNISPFSHSEVGEELDKVVSAGAKIFNALVRQEKLGAIRFNMAIDPNEKELVDTPAGDARVLAAGTKGAKPTEAVIEIILPAKGNISLNTMALLTSHEATHIRQRNLKVIDKFNKTERLTSEEVDVDVDAYRADITTLRDASIDVAENNPAVIAAAKNVLAATAKSHTAVAKEYQKIAQNLIDGNFNILQPTEESPSIVADFTVDAARTEEPSYVLAKSKLTTEQYEEETAEQEVASIALDAAFATAIKSADSPLSLFDESSYGHPDVYGHPEDNTSELIAGLENALNSHPQQLAAKLKHLPIAIQKTAMRFIKRVNADTQRANETGYIDSKTRALHKQLNNNVAWLEKELGDTNS